MVYNSGWQEDVTDSMVGGEAVNILLEMGLKKLGGKAPMVGPAIELFEKQSRLVTYQQQILRDHVEITRRSVVRDLRTEGTRVLERKSAGQIWRNIGNGYSVLESRFCLGTICSGAY